MQPASLKSDVNSSAVVWGSFCGGSLANFKSRIDRTRHCKMMLSYYIYRGQLPHLLWYFVVFIIFNLRYLMLHGFWSYFLLADMKWVTLDILIVHAFSVMHHPPPPPGVFMLAVIMRGFFIIHIMIDVPLVVVFMLQSRMIVLCQEHTEPPNTAVHRLRC